MQLQDYITHFHANGYVFRRGQHLCEFLHYFQIWKNGTVVATLSYDTESSCVPYPVYVSRPLCESGLIELLWAILAQTMLRHTDGYTNQRIWSDDHVDGWHSQWSDTNPGAVWTTPLSVFSESIISLHEKHSLSVTNV